MRILVASKFYYDRGGAEIVARRCVEAYQAAGHEVGVLAMDHPLNSDLPEASFLAPEVGFGRPVSMALRTLGFGSVRQTMRQALKEFRPNVVHFHNIHSYLSPVVVEMAKKAGCRTVWTLHDYKLLCPAYTLPRGENCAGCSGKPWGVMRNSCLHDSFALSVMGALEAWKWNRDRILEFTDIFVAPSRYMAEVMARGGFPEERIRIVGNCVGPEFMERGEITEAGDYFLYVGRLSPEKGVDTLIQAALAAGVKLKIAGGGDLLTSMKAKWGSKSNIDFTGPLKAREVAGLMRGAEAVVVPSEWPENNPLVVMEALCSGAPVVGSRAGGIPELIGPDCGLMFEPADREALTGILRDGDYGSFNRAGIRAEACGRYSPESFGCRMLEIIEQIGK